MLNVNSPQQPHISNTNTKPPVKTKSTTPIGYKTLRDPPKSWNSQISKANFNKTSPDQKYSELKNVRPKFFKMRNNIPRYLGERFFLNPNIRFLYINYWCVGGLKSLVILFICEFQSILYHRELLTIVLMSLGLSSSKFEDLACFNRMFLK